MYWQKTPTAHAQKSMIDETTKIKKKIYIRCCFLTFLALELEWVQNDFTWTKHRMEKKNVKYSIETVSIVNIITCSILLLFFQWISTHFFLYSLLFNIFNFYRKHRKIFSVWMSFFPPTLVTNAIPFMLWYFEGSYFHYWHNEFIKLAKNCKQVLCCEQLC